jgi:hypothetical protein
VKNYFTPTPVHVVHSSEKSAARNEIVAGALLTPFGVPVGLYPVVERRTTHKPMLPQRAGISDTSQLRIEIQNVADRERARDVGYARRRISCARLRTASRARNAALASSGLRPAASRRFCRGLSFNDFNRGRRVV